MKYLLLLFTLSSLSFGSLNDINSFEANFIQTVTDDKNKTLKYHGDVFASKPQNALWKYTKPITKDVYINNERVVVIEPELEQVLIKYIRSSFDFFYMIKHAKEIEKGKYITYFENTKFTIITKNKLIESISYIDEFENSVNIKFEKQKQNLIIDTALFEPTIPQDYDIIRE